MALNDNAVFVAAQGFVYVNDTVGAAAPSPSDIEAMDPEAFGAQQNTVKITGSPTSGTFTVTVAGTASAAIAYNATRDQVQAAIEAISTVGVGNTTIEGASLSDGSGYVVSFVGVLQGQTLSVSASGTNLTGGSTPAVTAATTLAANGWVGIGHTSRSKMPEWGFDGGKLEMKGSWQKERIRQVRAADPIEDSIKLTLEQWDPESLELYFGANVSNTDGVFAVDGLFNPVEKAFLVVLVDGSAKLGFYAPKASIARDSAVDIKIDDFSGLPIEAAFLNMGTRPLYQWISQDVLV